MSPSFHLRLRVSLVAGYMIIYLRIYLSIYPPIYFTHTICVYTHVHSCIPSGPSTNNCLKPLVASKGLWAWASYATLQQDLGRGFMIAILTEALEIAEPLAAWMRPLLQFED